MTPGAFKTGGAQLTIHYDFSDSPFGTLLVASTAKGICHMHFADNATDALASLQEHFPHAAFDRMTDALQQRALHIFHQDWRQIDRIKLHLSAPPFNSKSGKAC